LAFSLGDLDVPRASLTAVDAAAGCCLVELIDSSWAPRAPVVT
jgi:hypothetical protein